jgi:hypothetical protein
MWLVDWAGRLERAANEGGLDSMASLMDELEPLYTDSCRALNKGWRRLRSSETPDE